MWAGTTSSFIAGVCNTCKRVPITRNSPGIVNIKVLACSACRLYYYCGVDCQRRDRAGHKQFCKAAETLRKQNPEVFRDQTLGTEDAWVSYRRTLFKLFADFILLNHGRPLNASEKNALALMRVCFVCFRVNCDHYTCSSCFSVFSCEAHFNSLCPSEGTSHLGCGRYALTLACDQIIHSRGSIPLQIPERSLSSNSFVPDRPATSSSGWTAYLRCRKLRAVESESGAAPRKISKSETVLQLSQLSFPLTIVFLLERLPSFGKRLSENDTLLVHVVGAALSPDICQPTKYEELFHMLPLLKHLDLWMIGPAVPSNLVGTLTDVQLCRECQTAGCTATMKHSNLTYHLFMETSDFTTPDIAVAFNAGLHEHMVNPDETWTTSLRRIAEANLPCAFTSYNAEECRADAETFASVGGSITLGPCVNPYQSLRPHRETYNLGFFYSWNACIFASGPVPLSDDCLISVQERTNEKERFLLQR